MQNTEVSNDAAGAECEVLPKHRLALVKIVAAWRRLPPNTTGWVHVPDLGPIILGELRRDGFVELLDAINKTRVRPLLKAHQFVEQLERTRNAVAVKAPKTRRDPLAWGYGSCGEPIEAEQ